MKKILAVISIILTVAICIGIISPGVFAVETENEKSQNCIETTEDFTAPKTKITNEVVSLRDRFSKHFRYEDGTYVASQYSSPVHYLNNGEWRSIDNTLVLNEDKLSSTGQPTYTNKASDVALSFPQNFSEGQSIEIQKDGYSFDMKIIGDEESLSLSTAKINNDYGVEYSTEDMSEVEAYNDRIMTVDNLVSEISYPSVAEGVDLEYIISSAKVKENIIVNSKRDDYSFKFEVNYGGLAPVVDEDGSIMFFGENKDEPVYTIDVPYMYDANGEESDEISILLEGNILTLTADSKWVNAWGRKYPVTIDPGVTTASMSAASTYVSYNNKTTNYSSASTLYAGKSLLDVRRTYLKYALPVLPSNAVINSAEIGLVLNSCSGFFGDNCPYIYFFDLTGKNAWSPTTLSWNNQPLSQTINGPRDAGTPIVAKFKGNVIPHHVFMFDATQKVKSWYENNDNNGIMVTTSNESSFVQPSFYRSSTSSDRPYVTVEYTYNVGYEDYWTYHVKDMGRSGKLLVNTYNGACLYTHEDASTNGLIFPVTVSHIYNSDSSFSSGRVGNMYFGKGFRLNVIETMSVQDGYTIIHTDSDGTKHNFNVSENNLTLYYHEDDSTIELVKSSNAYTVNFSDGSSKLFNSSGYLTRVTDKNGNQVNINYTDNRITSVTDGANRSITFGYNSNDYLTSITDFAGRVTQYVYRGSDLNKIIYNDSTETSLSFSSSSGRVIDTSGIKTSFYASSRSFQNNHYYMVDGIDTYNESGNRITESYYFSYYGTSTKISDNNRDYVSISYDNCGRSISFETNNDPKANRILYHTTGNLRNKVASSSYSFSSVTNLIDKSMWSVMQWTGMLPSRASRSIDTTKKHTYGSSVKITGDASNIALSPGGIRVEPGETYTFMANLQIDDTLFGGKVFLRATSGSEIKTSSKITTTNGSWQILAVTITIPQGVSSLNIELVTESLYGIFYVDAVQLVKGNETSYFNLIPDSDFSAISRCLGGSDWTAICPSDKYSYGDYGLNVRGSFIEDRYFTQVITASGLADEKFVFGLSHKAECSDIGLDTMYGAKITFVSSGSDVCTKVLLLDKDKYNRWQNIVTEVSSTAAFDHIRIELHYDYYEGDAFFNNLFLYRNCGFGKKYNYNDDGNLTQLKYGNNNSINVAYSGANISSVTQRKGSRVDSSVSYTYDSNNNVLTETDEKNIVTTYTYPSSNNKGLPTAVTVSKGGLSSTIAYTYTSNYNHIASVTDAAGSVTSYTYDPVTELVSYITDPRGNHTYYEYDATGSVTTSISSDSIDDGSYDYGPASTEFVYDNSFRLIGLSACNGRTYYDLTYDSYGRNDTVSCADYGILKDYSYNSDSTLSDVDYGNGDNVHYVYNNKKELTSVAYNGTTEIDYSYTADGLLSEIYDEDNQLTTSYTYNTDGLTVGCSRSDGKNVRYKYDSLNRLNGYTVSVDNSVVLNQSYVYDNCGNLINVYYDQGSGFIDYSYDSLGRMTYATNICHGYEFDICYSYKSNGNNQTGYVDTIDYLIYDNGFSELIPSLSYDYDENGNIIAVYENGEQIISYTYDKLNRLILECNSVLNYSFFYDYNNQGDIILSKRCDFSSFNNFDNNPRSNIYTYANHDWESLLTRFKSKNIEYDENGNPTLYRGFTMTWQRGRQLASATNTSYNISYNYDHNGLRTEKTVNGVTTEYFYDGSTLLGQQTGNDTIYFIYDGYGSPYGFIYNGTTYFYLTNLQGDIIGIYDTDYNVVVRYNYNAWGMLYSTTGTLASTIGEINPLRYRGYYYDTETSLYYLQSRYYDPESCRFISADAYIVAGDYLTGINMFAYCLNNPVMYSDPSGEEPEYSPTQLVAQMILMSFCASALLDHLDYNTVVEIASLSVDIGLDMFEFISMSSDILNGNDEDYYSIAAEHKKRGTTNPAHKNKHQKGRKRVKTDKKGGEKGDIRRPKDRSNKRPNINSNTMVVVATATAIVATGVALAVVVPELIIPATAVILV